MLTDRAAALLAALKQTFPLWDCTVHGDNVTFTRRSHGPYQTPRHAPSWAEMLNRLDAACAEYGVARARPLPLCGLEDAELTFSAVQALDPYLKHHQCHTNGAGFFPQPVVRFTGKRDNHGRLLPGFLTSFVNTSIVQPVGEVSDHTALIDSWLGVLSRLGLHSQHLTITGSLNTWHRAPVAGITLRFLHMDMELGDAVLLWNSDDPSLLATDVGSGLERLRWIITRRSWPEVVYGELDQRIDPQVVDAVRTATLIVGAGIRLAPHGPGSSVRRLLRAEASHAAVCGLSRVVRWAHRYWNLVCPLQVPWSEVCRVIDTETAQHREPRV